MDRWVYDSDVLYSPGTDPALHSTYTCQPGPTSNCTYEGFFSVQYGGNTCAVVSGNVTYDKVNISGTVVPDMGVEMADVAGCISNYTPDGILGLSFGENNQGIFSMKWSERTKLADSIRSYSKASYIHGTPHPHIG